MTRTIALLTIEALSARAEREEAAILAAFERLQAGDASAEAVADAAQARLERLLDQMGAIEAQLVGGAKARGEIAEFLAA